MQATMQSQQNQTVVKRRVGAVITMRDGRKYEIQKDGSWRVLNKPISRRKRAKLEGRAK